MPKVLIGGLLALEFYFCVFGNFRFFVSQSLFIKEGAKKLIDFEMILMNFCEEHHLASARQERQIKKSQNQLKED